MNITIDNQEIRVSRETKETRISLDLAFEPGEVAIQTEIPFLNHLLHAMAFHGGFSLKLRGEGDVAVDPHHLAEDVGLCLGSAFQALLGKSVGVKRYGHSIIPMDEALSEVSIDVCQRPFCVFQADLPQPTVGNFDCSLIREFFLAFANTARISLHATCRYGQNSHHMLESLFKAFGKCLKAAYAPSEGGLALMSTKGIV